MLDTNYKNNYEALYKEHHNEFKEILKQRKNPDYRPGEYRPLNYGQ